MKHQFFMVFTCLIFVVFSTAVSIANLAEGLVAYWPLDGDANDNIGGHDGKLMGGASFVKDGERGEVLSVDGNDGHVEIPHSADLVFAPTDSFSIAVWLNIQTLPGHWAGIVTKSRDQSPWYGLWVTPGNQWHFVGGQGGANVRMDVGKAVTGWLHLAGVYDADAHTQTVYVDGKVIGEQNNVTIAASGAGDIWFGGAKSVNEYLKALIDDVLLYKRALDSGEIQDLASGVSILSVEPDAKLAASWGAIKQ
ncbi:MAG: LamG domain-containing protein [Candidatus Poribacteria bacterium]